MNTVSRTLTRGPSVKSRSLLATTSILQLTPAIRIWSGRAPGVILYIYYLFFTDSTVFDFIHLIKRYFIQFNLSKNISDRCYGPVVCPRLVVSGATYGNNDGEYKFVKQKVQSTEYILLSQKLQSTEYSLSSTKVQSTE